MSRVCSLILVVVAGSIAACKGSDPAHHSSGAESFVSQPPGGTAGRGTMANGTAGAPGAAVPATSSTDATASPTRTIEEADIYQRDATLLYVLNTYRGLEVIDLADVAAPRLLSHVAVTGRPVDLYLRNHVAIVAVSDAFTYYALADGSVRPHRGSRVLAVNVTDPANPVVASDLPIEGEVEQTRIVGDVLYVVSRKYSWYDWTPGGTGVATGVSSTGGAIGVGVSVAPGSDTIYVASFDVHDPARPAAVARIDFAATGWDAHANVTPERITLSFAGYGPSDQNGQYGPMTQFRVVDISDPGGAMTAGATFSMPGMVNDRWGMDYDATTGLFRAVSSLGWNAGAALYIWSSPAAVAATNLSHLVLPVTESLTAARFDGSRVYVVTAQRVDPLWGIDASDPARPVVAGALHMPGQLDFIEPRGDRLVALGHTNEAGQPFQLAVSLLDVTQLSQPALLDRVTFGSSWSWVAAQPDDLRKAFIVLDPPPTSIGLILVPLQGWDRDTYRFAGGTQLVDFALDHLTLRGFLAHPGTVTRSFPLDANGTQLAALSDAALQTINASNRSSPAEIARLDLARSVATLAVVHGKAVELAGDWTTGVMELVVTDALDPDAATPLARVDLAAPEARIVRDGDTIWVLAHDASSGKSWLQAIDVADPSHPRARGRLDLANGESFGYWRSWGFGDEVVLVGHALAVHHASWACPGVCALDATGSWNDPGQVRIFDLADPDHPRLASTVSPSGAAWAWGLSASGSFLWLTHFEWDTLQQMGRYFLDRVDLSNPADPKLLPKINVPGVFLAASEDGSRIYTLETWWETDRTTTSLHRLLLLSSTARLEATVEIDGSPAGAVAASGFAWLVASPSWGSSSAPRLVTVDLGPMETTSDDAVSGGWAWLRATAGGKLFLDGSWNEQGLLLYDLSDPAHPTFDQFFRTPSWVWDVVVADGRAYLPSGPYGVPVIELH